MKGTLHEQVEEARRRAVRFALQRARGCVPCAAALLGAQRTYVYMLARRHGVGLGPVVECAAHKWHAPMARARRREAASR